MWCISDGETGRLRMESTGEKKVNILKWWSKTSASQSRQRDSEYDI